ncbi:MAG TPA: polyprenyl synthetase family protein [Verrucomicrobiae bacterium]|nr:polyprenyl synthetase family protein [Verrucomicrobiae bacterium]
MLPFLDAFCTDLNAVNSLLKQEFKLKTGSVPELVPLKLENLDYNLRPALLLAAARAYGYGGERAIMVASVVQFIYLATKVHGLVNKDVETTPGDFQFPVLVGDYLYGQFFLHLCKADALEYLTPLSKVICEIHEAGVIRQQGADNTSNSLEVLNKEEASLIAEACRIGAQLGGAPERDQELFWQFGRNLGLGIGAFSRGMGKQWAMQALREAREVLPMLPVAALSLGEISRYFENQLSKPNVQY